MVVVQSTEIIMETNFFIIGPKLSNILPPILLFQEDNVTTPVLGTFCGNTIPANLDTFGSNVRLLFHSDGNQQDKNGFLIRVNASIEGICS